MGGFRKRSGRLAHRAVNRVRGLPDMDQLVAGGLRLGRRPHISHRVYIDGIHPWLITIGDYVTLGPFVAIITHDTSLVHYTGTTRIGRVDIGDRVYIGVGAVILPGTTIGENSVVGAGAVVQGEISPGSLVLGNPGKASPIKPIAAWHRASASRSPSWPREGWTMYTGITEERKREQRDALANGTSGYVPATAAPGSPYVLDNPDAPVGSAASERQYAGNGADGE